MVLGIGSNMSGISAWGSQGLSASNLDGAGLGRFTPSFRPNIEAQQQQNIGYNIQLRNIPEALQFLAKEIEEKFKIKVHNSDIPFSEEELRLLNYVLANLPGDHLKGVKTIVKNKSIQLNMETMPESIFAKRHNTKVYGAYDKTSQRILVFDLDNAGQLVPVVKHEVGHSVHTNNMSFDEFFHFTLKSGCDVVHYEQTYIGDNRVYNIEHQQIKLSKQETIAQKHNFDMDSMKSKQSKYGKYSLIAPVEKQHLYAYTNPCETFASYYEKAF
ncbi:MAG: hypothetical protein WCH76_08110 [Candidatus Riflemargulisbacteria bacterium]